MRFRFIVILSILSFQALFTLLAQPNKFGVPMITNYPYNEIGGSEQNWCITQDHRGVVYVGNYEQGVLEYDGVEWRSIPIPNRAPVWSLATDDQGVIYVGAEGDFGLLEPNQHGELLFRSLFDSTLRLEKPDIIVWKTYFNEGKVWFCTHTGIFVFDPQTDGIDLFSTPENAYHSYIVDGKIYNSDWGEGLMVFENNQFESLPGGDFFHEMAITGLDRFDSQQLLVSTMENGIYLLNTESGEIDNSFLGKELMNEFRSNLVTYTKLLDPDLLVCTYSNGLYVLDRSGNVKEIISESEGLIDNTISHVYTDNRLNGTGPLWIANWKGVSKVEANNPFRVFTESSGFENLITDIVHFRGQLFISTMSGVFYKSSEDGKTQFRHMPEIENNVNDMQVFEPGRGRSFLLVSTDRGVYVIDERMRVSTLEDILVNPPDNPVDLEQVAGRFILNDPERANVIYIGSTRVLGIEYSRGQWKEFFRSDRLNNEIFHMARDRYGYLWVSTPGEVVRIDMELSPAFTMKNFSSESGLPMDADNTVFLNPESKNLMVGTRNGFYRFNYFQESFVPDSLFNSMLPAGSNIIRTFHHDKDGDYWFSFENEHSGWSEMVVRERDGHLDVVCEKPFQRLPSAASADMFFSDPESGVWFSKSDELYHFNKTFSRKDTLPFQTLIRKVLINNDSVLFNGSNFKSKGNGRFIIQPSQGKGTQPLIKYRFNNIEFHWAAPYFEQEDRLQYSYFLDGYSKAWSEWQSVPFKEFTNLKYGKYELKVIAKNVYGMEGNPASYAFVITRPWFATFPAILGYILLAGLLVYALIRLYTKRLTRENLRLEGVIQERTAEIRKQKEELTDSIEYASRIQRALLPSETLMEERNIDHFILFRPRDIV
ncbi:MAG: triple tyrosine motif-containing protein, partial [Bacteroides sp.]|nr:triple tyrosine motif-containing protein [Bacteroides sp.]